MGPEGREGGGGGESRTRTEETPPPWKGACSGTIYGDIFTGLPLWVIEPPPPPRQSPMRHSSPKQVVCHDCTLLCRLLVGQTSTQPRRCLAVDFTHTTYHFCANTAPGASCDPHLQTALQMIPGRVRDHHHRLQIELDGRLIVQQLQSNGSAWQTYNQKAILRPRKAAGLRQPAPRARADPWLEACVYACARLVSMAMHAYERLHPSPPHACPRLGSGTQRWTSCVIMHWLSAEIKAVLVEVLFKGTVF